MRTSTSMRWLVVAVSAAMLLAVAAACSSETVEVPGETVVVEKEVIKEVMVPGETVTVEVIKEVEVPGETIVVKEEVVKEVMVPGETVVVEKEVVKTVEVPGETVTVEVVKTVEVPGQTVVVEKEVVKTVEVPGQTVVVEKVVVQEVPGKKYVTDPVTGRVFAAHEYGGTMTPAQGHDRDTNGDPYVSIFAHQLVSRIVNEKLGALDWALDRDAYFFNTGSMVPVWTQRGVLAESWEQPDDKTIIVNVRQGVNWHDKAPMNGRELTADDVAWNFRRYLGRWEFAEAGPGVYTGDFGELPWESIEATDKYTVAFKLTEPNTRALMLVLDWWHAFILPPEVIEQYGDLSDWRNQVGTGPYELTDRVLLSHTTYTKNPNYWGFDPKWPENRLPYFDKIQLTIIPELATRLAGMRAGKLDYMDGVNVIDQALSLQRTNPELQLWPSSGESDNTVGINPSKPPFTDIRVRQAMQMALDLETMNYTYFKGVADWIPRGLVGRTNKGYMTPYEEWSDELKGYFDYDPAGAEALLDAAGLERDADGIRFKTEFVHREGNALSWAEFMVSYWRDIGIEVDILATTNAAWTAKRNAGDYGLTSAGSGVEGDPMWNIGVFYSKGPHGAQVSDDQYDAWYEAALAAATVEEQKRLISLMDMRMIEQFWYIWGPAAPSYSVTWPWLQGFDGEGHLGGGSLQHLWQYLWIDSAMKEEMGY